MFVKNQWLIAQGITHYCVTPQNFAFWNYWNESQIKKFKIRNEEFCVIIVRQFLLMSDSKISFLPISHALREKRPKLSLGVNPIIEIWSLKTNLLLNSKTVRYIYLYNTVVLRCYLYWSNAPSIMNLMLSYTFITTK